MVNAQTFTFLLVSFHERLTFLPIAAEKLNNVWGTWEFQKENSQRSVTHNSMIHRVRFREILDVYIPTLTKINVARRHMVHLKVCN